MKLLRFLKFWMFVFVFILLGLLVGLSQENAQLTSVSLLNFTSPQWPLFVFIALAFFLGAISLFILMLPTYYRYLVFKRTVSSMRKES